MPDTTDTTEQVLPAWWHEIAAELRYLHIASLAMTRTGSAEVPEWNVVVIFHAPSSPDGHCAAFPWVLGARPTEKAAWKAAETFLRGLATVRKSTLERVPQIKRADTPENLGRLWEIVGSILNDWHRRHPEGDT